MTQERMEEELAPQEKISKAIKDIEKRLGGGLGLEEGSKSQDDLNPSIADIISGKAPTDSERLTKKYPKIKSAEKITESGVTFSVDPQTGKKYPEIGGGQYGIEIPPGLDLPGFEPWLENRLRAAEATREFMDLTTITYFRYSINDYNILNVPPDQIIEIKDRLVCKVEARGFLWNANFNLGMRKYEDFATSISALGSERLTELWERLPGLPQAVSQIEANNGAFFRLTPNPDPQNPHLLSKKVFKEQVIQGLVGLPGINSVVDARVAVDVAERLSNVTFMASYYAGPVDQAGNLIDEQVMDEVDALGGNLTGTKRYFENEEYWNRWRQGRIAGLSRFVPDPHDPTKVLRDPAANARRLMYAPEEFNEIDFGNAVSLRYATETYTRSLAHLKGVRRLGELMQLAVERQIPHDPTSPLKGNLDDIFKWGSLVKGAGEAVIALGVLLEEPLKGGEATGNPGNFKTTIENIVGVIEKFKPYLYLASKKIYALSVARVLESTINYVNSNTPDRKLNFPDWPKLGTWFRNQTVKAFASQLLPALREETKRTLRATDMEEIAKDFSYQGRLVLWDVFKKFWGQALSLKG